MGIVIKKMETDEEVQGKAYVHWRAWHEAYADLVDREYLDTHTLEKCTKIANRFRDGLFVAKDGERVIGFCGYGAYRDDTMQDTGEVYAIYLLKEYYGKKIGYALMNAAVAELAQYRTIALWTLDGNDRAIGFYQRYGFRFDGVSQTIELGRSYTERRMILRR